MPREDTDVVCCRTRPYSSHALAHWQQARTTQKLPPLHQWRRAGPVQPVWAWASDVCGAASRAIGLRCQHAGAHTSSAMSVYVNQVHNRRVRAHRVGEDIKSSILYRCSCFRTQTSVARPCSIQITDMAHAAAMQLRLQWKNRAAKEASASTHL